VKREEPQSILAVKSPKVVDLTSTEIALSIKKNDVLRRIDSTDPRTRNKKRRVHTEIVAPTGISCKLSMAPLLLYTRCRTVNSTSVVTQLDSCGATWSESRQLARAISLILTIPLAVTIYATTYCHAFDTGEMELPSMRNLLPRKPCPIRRR